MQLLIVTDSILKKFCKMKMLMVTFFPFSWHNVLCLTVCIENSLSLAFDVWVLFWLLVNVSIKMPIDFFNISHCAPAPHPTVHHFVTEMCTCVHISVANGALWIWCIVGFVRWVYWRNAVRSKLIHKARTKWLSCCRWQFQLNFLGWKLLYFCWSFTQLCC